MKKRPNNKENESYSNSSRLGLQQLSARVNTKTEQLINISNNVFRILKGCCCDYATMMRPMRTFIVTGIKPHADRQAGTTQLVPQLSK